MLDEIDPAARLIGAVNTVVNRQGRLIGYNTDGLGFLRSLAEDLHFLCGGKRILLLGAGGACRAALVSLAQAGAASIAIANRTRSRAEALVGEFRDLFPATGFDASGIEKDEFLRAIQGIDLVNTSAVGLKGESPLRISPGPAWPAMLPFTTWSTTRRAPLVLETLRRGHPASGGLGMLAGQAKRPSPYGPVAGLWPV
ncbi:MAG: hypothetical protein R2864_10435 [Syntrophotaleaceae bacterium]